MTFRSVLLPLFCVFQALYASSSAVAGDLSPLEYSDFDRGVMVGLQPLMKAIAEVPFGYGDTSYWTRQVRVRAISANTAAAELKTIVQRVNQKFLKADLERIAVQLGSISDSGYLFEKQLHDQVEAQSQTYGLVSSQFGRSFETHAISYFVLEDWNRGLIAGTRVALISLAARTDDLGSKAGLKRQINLRWLLAAGISAELKRLVPKIASQALGIVIREIAIDLQSFRNQDYSETHSWVKEAQLQSETYDRALARFERLVKDLGLENCDQELKKRD